MPKYYNGDKELLFPATYIEANQVNPNTLAEIFARGTDSSICVSLPGLEPTCLGYIFHVSQMTGHFQLRNICSQIELSVDTLESLSVLILHVCGVKFSPNAQAVFQKIRNDIGGAGTPPLFKG